MTDTDTDTDIEAADADIDTDTEPGDTPSVRGRAGARVSGLGARGIAIRAVAVVVVLALAVLALLQTASIRSHADLQNNRAAAVQAAKTEIVDLLSVSASSATSDLKHLLAGATASFHDQLQQQATAFRQALTSGKVVSTGAIAGAGLVSMKGDKAVVVIAARASVKNSAAPKGNARNYRLTVDVVHTSGKWLVSGITFVA